MVDFNRLSSQRVRLNDKLIYLTVCFLLLLLISFTTEIVLYLRGISLSGLLYVLPWVALVYYVVYRFIKKVEGIKFWDFIGYAFVAGLFIAAISMPMSEFANNMFEKKYVGTYGIDFGVDFSTDSEVSHVHKTKLFEIKDERGEVEYDRLIRRYDDASTEEYIWWQTGFADGYEPASEELARIDSPIKVLVLLVTVGPIFLVEKFLSVLVTSSVLFLFPLVGLFFDKGLEKELRPFVEQLKRK